MTPTKRRVAILTEGDAEFATLATLYPQIHRESGLQLLKPLKVSVAPDAVPRLIAKACRAPLLIAKTQHRADAAIVVLDRETTNTSAGERADELARALGALGVLETTVVLKDRMYENWLVADVAGLATLTGRFAVSPAMTNRVVPNKADRCDALALLKQAAIRRPYQKVGDAKRIVQVMSVANAAENSRSFRKFLAVCGYHPFAFQSRRPGPTQR